MAKKFLTISNNKPTADSILIEDVNNLAPSINLFGVGRLFSTNIMKPLPEWQSISSIGTNEIKLLIGKFKGDLLSFAVLTSGFADYTVDWGDGINTTYKSGQFATHLYTSGGVLNSMGYTTFIVTITSSADITRFDCIGAALILKANLNTPNLTSLYGMFNSAVSLTEVTLPSTLNSVTSALSAFQGCTSLTTITMPLEMNSCTITQGMFSQCLSLQSFTFPTTMNSLTDMTSMFQACSSLTSVTMPTTLNLVTTLGATFSGCSSLTSVTLPSSMPAITTVSNTFTNCYLLQSVTLPSTTGLLTTANQMFLNCYSLSTITNLDLWNVARNVTMTQILTSASNLSSVTINQRMTAFGFNAPSVPGVALCKVTSIRLLNQTAGQFTGTSPQIDVSYTSLTSTGLNTLFSDLPTVTGKTIKITNSIGANTCDTSIATAKGWTVTN